MLGILVDEKHNIRWDVLKTMEISFFMMYLQRPVMCVLHRGSIFVYDDHANQVVLNTTIHNFSDKLRHYDQIFAYNNPSWMFLGKDDNGHHRALSVTGSWSELEVVSVPAYPAKDFENIAIMEEDEIFNPPRCFKVHTSPIVAAVRIHPRAKTFKSKEIF